MLGSMDPVGGYGIGERINGKVGGQEGAWLKPSIIQTEAGTDNPCIGEY